MEIYYVTISLLVQEFIMFSHINKFTKLTFGYTKILERFTIKNWQNQKMEMKIFWRVLWNKTRISPSLSHETQSCTVACDLANKKKIHILKRTGMLWKHTILCLVTSSSRSRTIPQLLFSHFTLWEKYSFSPNYWLLCSKFKMFKFESSWIKDVPLGAGFTKLIS